MTLASFIAGTQPVAVSSGTVVNATTPANILNGDGLFAFVMARSALTPPLGWSLVDSAASTSDGITQTLYCYQKDVVTSANSSVSVTWQQAVSNRMIVSYAHCRVSAGLVRARGIGTFANNAVASAGFNIPSAGAAERPQSLFLAAGSLVNQINTSYRGPTPVDYTWWMNAYADNRLSCAWQTRGPGEPNSESFMQLRSTVATTAMQGLVVRVESSIDPHETVDQIWWEEEQDLSGSRYSQDVTEATRIQPSAIWGVQYTGDAIDGLAVVGDSFLKYVHPDFVEDTQFIGDVAVGVRGLPQAAVDTVGLSPMAAAAHSLVTREIIRTSGSIAGEGTYRLVLEDAVRAAARLRVGHPVQTFETVALHQVIQSIAGVRVAERLRLQNVLVALTRGGVSVFETLAMQDALRRFLAGDALDGIGVEAEQVITLRAVASMSDTVALGTTVTPRMLLRVTAPDAIRIEPLDAVRMIFQPELQDGVSIDAGYVAPDGSVTVWAINTRVGATTEYTGYNFNSFARMGNRYLGASSTGLYALDGDTDAGDSIVAAIRSGFMQVNGSRFAGFKGVYLGLRGAGEYLLKIEEGDGTVRTYKVLADSMETTKVQVGKGLRARYFAFELINEDGQDFDLDTVEFVPMLAQRRV